MVVRAKSKKTIINSKDKVNISTNYPIGDPRRYGEGVKNDTPSDLAISNDKLSIFDYTSLSADTAKLAKESAIEIKAREKAIWENIIEIGNRLIEVKNALPHGQFESWVKSEFKWHRNTSAKYIKIAKEIKSNATYNVHLPSSVNALYQLASSFSDSDEETKEQILEKVEVKTEEKGKPLTEKEIKEITKEYEEKINQLQNEQTSLLKELNEEKRNTDWQGKVIREFNLKGDPRVRELESKLDEKNKEIAKLNNEQKDLDSKKKDLQTLIDKEVNIKIKDKLDIELKGVKKKESELKTKEIQLERLQSQLQNQKDMFNAITDWCNNFQLTNEYLLESCTEIKKYRSNIKILPDLSNLDDENKIIIETKIKNLITDFNDNLQQLGNEINILHFAVDKLNNSSLHSLEAEVIKDNE